jgi:phosphatidylinositol glycan class O
MDETEPVVADSAAGARQRIFNQPSIQLQTRSKIRQQKLKVTFIGYVIVLVFLAAVQFIGIGFFTSGFLLSRKVLPNISQCSDEINSCLPPKFDKTILLVIDALRFDFAIPINNSDEFYHNNFPILYDLSQKDSGLLLKFMADPPTTTLQRLKGLTTGSLPTFIDAGSNFDGDAINEDNWLLQLWQNNKTIAFMGDDTWDALFNQYIDPKLNFPYDSLNVWDLHTVDNGVIEHLYPLLETPEKWDLLVGHFLGVDHVGHRYGPNHYTMKQKLNQMNDVISHVVDKMDDKTLLIVMGDHGMDSTGNHGGDAPDELESTLFMYSKNAKFLKKDLKNYDITKGGANYRQVNQIDLVPTISLLLGLPIPYNNLGFPIDEVFSNEKELNLASLKAILQLQQFRSSTPNLSPKLNTYYQEIIDKYSPNQLIVDDAKLYQLKSLEECKRLWAEFDLKLISLGLAILFLALTFMLTYARSIPSIRVLTMSFEFIGSVIAMCLLGLVLSFSIYVVFRPTGFSLKNMLGVGAALGTIVGFWAPIMDRFSVNWLIHSIIDFFVYNFNSWSFLGLLFVGFHTLIFASNSYVVWEDQMVSFFVATFGVVCTFGCLTKNKLTRSQRILGFLHAATFTLFARIVSSIRICREEQRPYCVPNFEITWWSIVLLHVGSYLLPMIIMQFYKLSNSYHSAAKIWIGGGLKILLFANATYWTFEYIQNSEYFNGNNNLILSGPLLKSLKLAIARLALFASLCLANFGWSRGPLCVKLEMQKNLDENGPEQKATILGYGNVYGSSYFLLVLNFAVAIMLVTKPLGAISLNILIVQILSLLELIEILEIRKNLISPIVFGLLGYQHFFSTGHQATIPSIQWEIGFMTTETIFFPFTHLNIVLNTFGSFIIICLAIPLITIWKIVPSNKPITVLSQIITNITTLLTYQVFISFSSLVFAAHFRRHLMVWKIFAPRFMLSGMLLILINLILVILTLWFGTGKIVTQVNRIFGK